MKKQYRVKKNQEIEEILANKKSAYNPYFSIYKMNNPKTSHFRYAISVGKKIGNAVTRNHLKRRIRAALQILNIPLDNNVDIFIIARPKANELEFNDLVKQIEFLLIKLHIIKGEKND